MNPIYTTLGGLLCPASMLIAYIMLIVGYQITPDAHFHNPWDDEDDDNENP